MRNNRSYRVRQGLLVIVAALEEELDYNPTTAELRDWFKSRPETKRNEIRLEIHKRKIERQKQGK